MYLSKVVWILIILDFCTNYVVMQKKRKKKILVNIFLCVITENVYIDFTRKHESKSTREAWVFEARRGRGRVRSNVRLRSRWNLVSIVIRRMPEERSLKSSCVYIHSARFAPRRVSITPPAFAKALQKANVNSWIMKIEVKENNMSRILSATRARESATRRIPPPQKSFLRKALCMHACIS